MALSLYYVLDELHPTNVNLLEISIKLTRSVGWLKLLFAPQNSRSSQKILMRRILQKRAWLSNWHNWLHGSRASGFPPRRTALEAKSPRKLLQRMRWSFFVRRLLPDISWKPDWKALPDAVSAGSSQSVEGSACRCLQAWLTSWGTSQSLQDRMVYLTRSSSLAALLPVHWRRSCVVRQLSRSSSFTYPYWWTWVIRYFSFSYD